MALSFQPVTLDTGHQDSQAMLVFRDDRLFAVVTELSDLHEERAGDWYVETLFNDAVRAPRETFSSLAKVKAWIADTQEG